MFALKANLKNYQFDEEESEFATEEETEEVLEITSEEIAEDDLSLDGEADPVLIQDSDSYAGSVQILSAVSIEAECIASTAETVAIKGISPNAAIIEESAASYTARDAVSYEQSHEAFNSSKPDLRISFEETESAPTSKMLEFKFTEKPVYDFFKRCFDIGLSLLSIVVFFPFFLVIAALIYLEDGGNPIFIQERIGKGKKVFKMFKFRSMHVGAESKLNDLLSLNESDGKIFKLRNDPRVTKIGRIIRKTSIDEFPQLLNVLMGSMSLIGPRPFVPYEMNNFNEYESQRLLVKPGMSCFWQVKGRSDIPFDNAIEYDLKYIMKRSLITDFIIILLTIKVVFKSTGAY
ncbi:MAG: sugar transferase [Clostridiales bacterium]|jgi:lipopolysaccharide/colanic/teichoic acid biosynthesis glycosyltransferase|nr:sugar transferase [Clostridiales bacterium]